MLQFLSSALIVLVSIVFSFSFEVQSQLKSNKFNLDFVNQKPEIVSIKREENKEIFIDKDVILGRASPLVFKNIGKVKVTAYSSTKDQTDDTPFIMASGKYVYVGAIASNFLPLGTKVKFPELFGDKVFVVEDRMNKRFNDRIDIWMPSKTEARNFGLKKVEVLVAY